MSVAQGPSSDLDAAQLAAILRWYADMGVDIAIDETPHDRFSDWATTVNAAQQTRAQETGPAPRTAAARTAPGQAAPAARSMATNAALSQDAAAQSAREIARSAQSLEELRAALDAFEGCALKRTATQLVFADGNPQARLMFVGEAPGADEDRMGLPFVGRAGQLLDRMLKSIGLDRTQVYIANVAPWRPPGNRTPTPQEIAICLPFIARQIELVAPKVLVCVGASSTQTLLGVKEGITRVRGHWYDYKPEAGEPIRTMPTLHPAYLLRTTSAKRAVWHDLREIRKALDQTA